MDCIELRQFDLGIKGTQAWCEVDMERCIGCELCVHLPKKDKSDIYVQLICPWEAIEMVPLGEAVHLVAQLGGPPEYLQENHDRLLGIAQRLAEARRQSSPTAS